MITLGFVPSIFAMLARFSALSVVLLWSAASAQPGTLDPTFGMGGRVTLSDAPPQSGAAVASLADGRVLVAGSINGDAAIYRFTAAGALDGSFGTDGVFAVDLGDEDRALDLVVLPSGRIVVAANQYNDGVAEVGFLLGVTSDGRLDTAFGNGGRVEVAQGGSGITGLDIDASGGILAALIRNEAPEGVFVVRYNADGTPDVTFGTDGETLLEGVGLSVRVTAREAGGAIVVGGRFLDSFSFEPIVARLGADGALDTSFAGDGIAELDFEGTFNILLDAAVDGQGRVVAVGIESSPTASALVVARLTPGGVLDPTFAGDGTTSLTLGQSLAQGTSVLLQPDGGILVGGLAGPPSGFGLAVARLLSDGQFDDSFGSGGVYLGPTDALEGLNDLTFRPDGRLIGVGSRLSPGGVREPPIALLAIGLQTGVAIPTTTPAPEAGFTLRPAWGNPSAGRVGVRLGLDAAVLVHADVFDPSGRRVATIHDGLLGAGLHTLAVPARLASGVYAVRVRAGDAQQTIAVTVVR